MHDDIIFVTVMHCNTLACILEKSRSGTLAKCCSNKKVYGQMTAVICDPPGYIYSCESISAHLYIQLYSSTQTAMIKESSFIRQFVHRNAFKNLAKHIIPDNKLSLLENLHFLFATIYVYIHLFYMQQVFPEFPLDSLSFFKTAENS